TLPHLRPFDLPNPKTGIGRAFRRKRTSSLDILSSKRAPRDYYKGKNCKSTGFHTRKGGYVVMQEKLPNYVVPDLTDFKLKPYVSQCPRDVKMAEAAESANL
ncbi:39S ribosomal protein L41-A, mitochondrial-like, partial [Hibiscus syriacus]|uniref:39S ribosomal protein L41-A, mitochondrial-like n=1 Tax=Hibiscus syriacus TaxID=106335 RepID=UPI001920ED09